MARPTPKDLETKAVLEAAAAALRAGKPIPAADRAAVADAIDLVLSPKGMPLIGRLQTLRDEDAGTTNVAIRMPIDLREHLKKQAAVAHATLSDDAADALNDFIDGKFAPEKQQRAPRGAAGTSTAKTGNLNVTPPASLIEQALYVSEERIQELGWMPRPSNIITAYLIDKYGRPDDTSTE
ncbi:hypothetical protein ABZ829_28035 [Streptomyces xanthochromogenes]|uniref:hypothetical protein n=1 Tax=Streptomyces xanthochromogenes TaxID=67384 RepID=UPI00343555DA